MALDLSEIFRSREIGHALKGSIKFSASQIESGFVHATFLIGRMRSRKIAIARCHAERAGVKCTRGRANVISNHSCSRVRRRHMGVGGFPFFPRRGSHSIWIVSICLFYTESKTSGEPKGTIGQKGTGTDYV